LVISLLGANFSGSHKEDTPGIMKYKIAASRSVDSMHLSHKEFKDIVHTKLSISRPFIPFYVNQ